MAKTLYYWFDRKDFFQPAFERNLRAGYPQSPLFELLLRDRADPWDTLVLLTTDSDRDVWRSGWDFLVNRYREEVLRRFPDEVVNHGGLRTQYRSVEVAPPGWSSEGFETFNLQLGRRIRGIVDESPNARHAFLHTTRVALVEFMVFLLQQSQIPRLELIRVEAEPLNLHGGERVWFIDDFKVPYEISARGLDQTRQEQVDSAFLDWIENWPSTAELIRQAELAARTNLPILLLGETGTGKSRLLDRIVEASGKGPAQIIECGRLLLDRQEDELFGREELGNANPLVGKIEAANGKTLIFEEIGSLPLDLQGSLLSVLSGRPFNRIGGVTAVTSRFRVICTTNRDLRALVAQGAFLADLYYRISTVPLTLPSLRNRPADAVRFANDYMREIPTRFPPVDEEPAVCPKTLTSKAEVWIRNHPWPGNLRQLRNTLERVCVLFPNVRAIGPEELDAADRMDGGLEARSLGADEVVQVPWPETRSWQDLEFDFRALVFTRAYSRFGRGKQAKAMESLGLNSSFFSGFRNQLKKKQDDGYQAPDEVIRFFEKQ